MILLNKFGEELNSSNTSKEPNQAIYECAHDWVSQGNTNCNGIVSYYSAYYSHERQKSSCKKIIKRAKENPTWYTPEEVLYVKMYKRLLKKNECKTDQCDS